MGPPIRGYFVEDFFGVEDFFEVGFFDDDFLGVAFLGFFSNFAQVASSTYPETSSPFTFLKSSNGPISSNSETAININ